MLLQLDFSLCFIKKNNKKFLNYASFEAICGFNSAI